MLHSARAVLQWAWSHVVIKGLHFNPLQYSIVIRCKMEENYPQIIKFCLNALRCQSPRYLDRSRASGVRTGGFRVSTPPPLTIGKETKTSLFGTICLFYTEIAEIAVMFLCAIQLAYVILKNFHCDAIKLVVKLL